MPAREAGAWRQAFQSIGWREPGLITAVQQILIDQGDLAPGQLSPDDYLIAVPVNGEAGRPHMVAVNGTARIDNRLARPSRDDRHRLAVGELPVAATRDGHLLATRNGLLLMTIGPIQWEWWPYVDLKSFESSSGNLGWTDAFSNSVSVRIRSSLSLGRQLFSSFGFLFGSDALDRFLSLEDIRSHRERDGDLAAVLFAFMNVVTHRS